MDSLLFQPCDTLKGVGPTLSAKLAQCGVRTLQDLLLHLPFRYQDRTHVTPIQDLRAHDWCVVVGQVQHVEIKAGKRTMLLCTLEDATGTITLRFFHFNRQQLMLLQQKPTLRAFGEVREFSNHLEIIHPEYQRLDETLPCPVEETFTPIYASTHGLSQTKLRQLVKQALILCKEELIALEWMRQEQLDSFVFQPLFDSIAQLHAPSPDTSCVALTEGQHPAIQRLAFDELLAQQVSLHCARKQRATLRAPRFSQANTLIEDFLNQLPFKLTSAQTRVYQEIHQDLTQAKPMLRLVQGDVGSGKTVIAALAALHVLSHGQHVALMAPTDLLTEQHAQTLSNWLQPLGLSVHRLSGKMKAAERKQTLAALTGESPVLVVGTHALFQADVTFSRLGLVMIDEQHRFGVEQRLSLQQKGNHEQITPHQLLLTATPIPRTLAMTHFSHLDLSIIDELPPGRTPIQTTVLHQNKRDDIIDRLHHALKQQRQVYWVCTLIDDSETLQCMAATESARYLQERLPNARVGLIHGRLKAPEKEATMAAFKQGEIDILVATTVIEVGVDVPNASLMIIENAERLGLSQLHQLRGRVGRGNTQSYCMLLYQTPLSQHSKARLQVMKTTCDGFVIAEKDLELRGRGELLGTRQTGYKPFKIADSQRDHALIPHLKNIAQHLLQEKPTLAHAIAARWLGEFETRLGV